MRLFFIRHGETVDNVASLYAGSRDSALTNHGVLQCRRLADHFASKLSPTVAAAASSATAITVPSIDNDEGKSEQAKRDDPSSLVAARPVHMFSSNLQRAVKTAEAIRDALVRMGQPATLAVQQLVELREQCFGSGEGQSFRVVSTRGKLQPHIGAETPQQMRARAETFLDEHLLPLLTPVAMTEDDDGPVVIVVSHGIMLSVLVRRLMDRLAGRCTWDAEAAGSVTDGREAPMLSWSNTGYLEAKLSPSVPSDDTSGWARVSMRLIGVNATDHLRRLRKTRGGIGSARFDEKQSTISSFFTKKRKLADAAD